jgi:hypothetical protein
LPLNKKISIAGNTQSIDPLIIIPLLIMNENNKFKEIFYTLSKENQDLLENAIK